MHSVRSSKYCDTFLQQPITIYWLLLTWQMYIHIVKSNCAKNETKVLNSAHIEGKAKSESKHGQNSMYSEGASGSSIWHCANSAGYWHFHIVRIWGSLCDSLYGGCVLLLSQLLTNLAAMFAHFCDSPSRYGSCLSVVKCAKSSWILVIWGKKVSPMSWYMSQVVRKCSSVSTSFCVQWGQILSSLGRWFCLYRPV